MFRATEGFKGVRASNPSQRLSFRFSKKQESVSVLGSTERNSWVNDAVRMFLNWDSYLSTDWSNSESARIGASVFLDSVELSATLPRGEREAEPKYIFLTKENAKELAKAETKISDVRPDLKPKGLKTSIVRSAIEHKRLLEGDPIKSK